MPEFDILTFLRESKREGFAPDEFVAQDILDIFGGVSRSTANNWINRQIKLGNVEHTGETRQLPTPSAVGTRARPVYRWVGGQPPPAFKERKLGKHKARGLYWPNGLIEIDERLRGMERLEVLLHEIDHHLHPDKSEEEVTRDAEKTAELLWGQRVRIIDAL